MKLVLFFLLNLFLFGITSQQTVNAQSFSSKICVNSVNSFAFKENTCKNIESQTCGLEAFKYVKSEAQLSAISEVPKATATTTQTIAFPPAAPIIAFEFAHHYARYAIDRGDASIAVTHINYEELHKFIAYGNKTNILYATLSTSANRAAVLACTDRILARVDFFKTHAIKNKETNEVENFYQEFLELLVDDGVLTEIDIQQILFQDLTNYYNLYMLEAGLAYMDVCKTIGGYYIQYFLFSPEFQLITTPVISWVLNPIFKALSPVKQKMLKLSKKFLDKFSKQVNTAGSFFDLSVFKNLTAKIPGGANNTNIGKTLFDDALKFKPTSGSQKTILDDILANGDNAIDGVASGSKTEALVDDIFQAQEYTKVDGKYFGNNGSNGFDNVFIKGSIDNPSEIIIIECKQMKSTGNVVLNPPASTGLPAQMSDPWVNYIAQQKLLNLGGNKTKLANNILSSQPGFIQKYVVAVDKTVGEINFLKLGNY